MSATNENAQLSNGTQILPGNSLTQGESKAESNDDHQESTTAEI